MGIIIEFFKFLLVKKKYWLMPIAVILLIFGGLIVLGEGSALTPFIYTLF